jgi:hypothetical protein
LYFLQTQSHNFTDKGCIMVRARINDDYFLKQVIHNFGQRFSQCRKSWEVACNEYTFKSNAQIRNYRHYANDSSKLFTTGVVQSRTIVCGIQKPICAPLDCFVLHKLHHITRSIQLAFVALLKSWYEI